MAKSETRIEKYLEAIETGVSSGLPAAQTRAEQRLKAIAENGVPAATTTKVGGITKGAAIANLTVAPTLTDFNGLLAILRSSGIIATT